MANERALKYIDVSKICPHPNNPRKDLGDLTELTASIKANGILQNLTVVLADKFCPSCKLRNPGFTGGVMCKDGHDNDHRPPCPHWESDGSVTVVIGHRRLAAAKLAGLKEVPCIVAEMSPGKQITTMLLENMQRNDLTVYEQAQGFQMMLSFGNDMNAIAEQTGFSESTIRRRIKLLELDPAKFKKSIDRGATLMDYAQLEKIENPEARNKVLDKIGTKDFAWELKSAIDAEEEAKGMPILLELMKRFATEVDQNDFNKQFVRSYTGRQYSIFEKPEDAGTVKYFFKVTDYGGINLYKAWRQSEDDLAYKTEKKQESACREALRDMTGRAYRLRYDFVTGLSNTIAKANMDLVIKYTVFAMFGHHFRSMDDLARVLDIDKKETKNLDSLKKIIIDKVYERPERILLLSTYEMLDSEGLDYYKYDNSYEPNTDLDEVYDFLENLGYELSEEERKLKDGTHELFTQKEGDVK